MFPNSYFAKTYFPDAYWPGGVGTPIPVVPTLIEVDAVLAVSGTDILAYTRESTLQAKEWGYLQ